MSLFIRLAKEPKGKKGKVYASIPHSFQSPSATIRRSNILISYLGRVVLPKVRNHTQEQDWGSGKVWFEAHRKLHKLIKINSIIPPLPSIINICYSVPNTVLGIEDTAVNRKDTDPCPQGTRIIFEDESK